MRQNTLRLGLGIIPGETSRDTAFRRAELKNHLSEKPSRIVAPEKLFSDLLKRQAREAMAAVTECPAVAIPHALARLGDIRETIRAAIRGELVPGCEGLRSADQLTHAHTLADLLECIEITRREHRAPVFLNSRDTEIAAIRHDLSQLAGLICSALPNLQMPETFCVPESEIES